MGPCLSLVIGEELEEAPRAVGEVLKNACWGFSSSEVGGVGLPLEVGSLFLLGDDSEFAVALIVSLGSCGWDLAALCALGTRAS